MHKAETMLLVITEEAIIMIIPFFVQVTGFGLPSKLCLTFDGTVCKVFLPLCHCPPLSSFPSLPFNPPPPALPRLSTHSSTYLLSSPSLTLPRVTEEHRVCVWGVGCSCSRTHPVLKGRRSSAARWLPGAAAPCLVRAPYHLLTHKKTHTEGYTSMNGRRRCMASHSMCQAHIEPWLHFADLLLQCQWSLCWPAPRDDPRQRQEKTGWTALIRWLPSHLWAVFKETLINIQTKCLFISITLLAAETYCLSHRN